MVLKRKIISVSVLDMAKIKLPTKPKTITFTIRLPEDLVKKLDKKRKSVKTVKLSRQALIEAMIDQLIDDLKIE